MEYTITRGLSELKTLKARYQKELREMNIIAVKHGSRLRKPYTSFSVEDFKKNAAAKVQSVEAIAKRIVEIKTQIDKANATTIVKIGSREMTISEALVEKSFIGLKKDLLNKYKMELREAREEFDCATEENKRRVEKIVSDKSAKEKDDTNEKEVTEMIDKTYPIELIDPSKLEDKIQKLEREIEEFESNVDFALSEINSTTKIVVSD